MLTADRVEWLNTQFSAFGWPKRDGYFQWCYEVQQRGEQILLLCRTGENLNGYCRIVWSPDYPPFCAAHIPEIQDLNVVPASRRCGVATRLMDMAESIVAERSPVIGIGVGLHPGYCTAQRMYVLRGYIPDARPVTYNNTFVTEGQIVKLDDDLVLHLTKNLSNLPIDIANSEA